MTSPPTFFSSRRRATAIKRTSRSWSCTRMARPATPTPWSRSTTPIPSWPSIPRSPRVPLLDAWLYLTGDEKLFGKLEGIGQETLRADNALARPSRCAAGAGRRAFIIGLLDRKESAESFAKRLKTRGSEDLLLAQTKNGEVIAIPGILEGVDNDKLRFRLSGPHADDAAQAGGRPDHGRPAGIAAAGRAAPDLHPAPRRGRFRQMARPRHQCLEGRVGLGAGRSTFPRPRSRACGSPAAR